MAKDGWMFLLPLAALSLICVLLGQRFGHGWSWAGLVLGVLACYVVWFFRDPERVPPADPSLLVSPGEGRVIKVRRVDDPFVGKGAWQVDIFLNIFNVHVQRSPFCRAATVAKVVYHKGKFLAADHPKASLDNEQNWVFLESGKDRVQVRQIAGLIARRINSYVKGGEVLGPAGRFGLIRFGSQVDLILPGTAEVLVREGDIVRAGLTPMAKLKTGRGPSLARAAGKPAKKASAKARR